MGHPILANAPIREAIIDLQFSQELPYEVIRTSASLVEKSFARLKKIHFGHVSLQVQDDPVLPQISNEEYGARLENEAGSKVLQLRRNGFTFSYVGHYSTWPEFSLEARQYWDRLENLDRSTKVQRIATRFINQVPLGAGVTDLDQILTAGPKIPEKLPQALSGFLSRVVIPFPVHEAISIVTQALEIVSPQSQNVIVDIDVFFQSTTIGLHDEEIWKRLAVLRDIKNEIFFSFLTQSTIERFK